MSLLEPFLDGLEDDKEHGDDEQESNGAYDHAADSAYAERVVTISAHTSGESQRQETEDHRHRRHEDGAQSDGSGIKGSLDNTQSLPAPRSGILGEQDGSLREQANQHNQSRLHVDVIFQSPQVGKKERTRQTEGDAEDDCQRNEQTLVEGAENQVDKDDADDEDERGGVLR